jgi:hypothetical protein
VKVLDLVRYDPERNCFVLRGTNVEQTCNCHPNSPFHWMHDKRPSIFLQDIAFRAKGVAVTMEPGLTVSQSLLAYKQFGIYSRAQPNVKPSLNKHEI